MEPRIATRPHSNCHFWYFNSETPSLLEEGLPPPSILQVHARLYSLSLSLSLSLSPPPLSLSPSLSPSLSLSLILSLTHSPSLPLSPCLSHFLFLALSPSPQDWLTPENKQWPGSGRANEVMGDREVIATRYQVLISPSKKTAAANKK